MNVMKSSDVEAVGGIYRYDMPPNVDLYNNIWKNQDSMHTKGLAQWGRQKEHKLLSLFGKSVNFSGKTVLDACCGLGRLSIASLELNASTVYAVDGSFEGLLSTSRREQKMRDYDLLLPGGKLIPVQCNMDNISKLFNKNSFDVIIHYMALHHMGDYKKILKDFCDLLKPGGLLAFNVLTGGAVSHPSTTHLRKIFLKEDSILVTEFLEKIGHIEGQESKKVHSLEDLILSDKKIDNKFNEIIACLKKLVEEFGIKAIKNNLQWESVQTPYLHNLNPEEVREYVKNNLNVTMEHYSPNEATGTNICVSKNEK
jgi:ubiquinone/menaquinone biosynthesis C-methylase UbiE